MNLKNKMMNPIFNKPKNKFEESAIDFLNKMQDPCDYNVYEIMAMFAQAELSKLSQHDVSGRSELFYCICKEPIVDYTDNMDKYCESCNKFIKQ